ncbi:MAG: methylenetetrahydrofolate reductase, partial [bacterium]
MATGTGIKDKVGFKDYNSRTGKPLISFEVFPPKTDQAMDKLRRVLPELVELKPDFMTVTYGALGTTRERTLEIVSLIKKTYGVETAAHLTCVGSSRGDLDSLLRAIARRGVRNIVALRGDPPKGETTFVAPADGLSHANELVAHIRAFEK